MSITAQVDTSSIDVSLDMNELRNEIAEVLGEEFDQLMENATPSEHTHIHKRIDAVDNRLCQIENRIDELTARIVGAGCMLTGTRS